MADILIKNAAYIITMDAERRIIRDGGLAIEKNQIVGVGKTKEIEEAHRGDVVIDATDKVVMPGLIDGHAHPAQHIVKGIADDVDEVTWVYKRMFPVEAELTAEDAYISALAEFVEMVKHGTTCHNNPGVPGVDTRNVDMTAEAMKEIGMRGILTRYTYDMELPGGYSLPKKFLIPTEEQVKMNEQVVRKWNGAENDLIRAWFSWRLPYNATDLLITESKKLADKYGVGIHTHANMTRGEEAAIRARWGCRTVERYEKLGALGPNMYMAHMCWTTLDEVNTLKKYDVKVDHNPSASMHAAYGAFAHGVIPEMIEKGITVTLGSDSACSGRTRDMFLIMYLAAAGHKDARVDPLVIGPYKALEMATVDCARGLLWDDKIGSLQVGKRADIITLDMKRSEWWPMYDVVANLAYSGDGSCVDNVIIDGKLVMKDKRIITVDTERALRELKERSRNLAYRLKTNYDIEIPSKWPIS